MADSPLSVRSRSNTAESPGSGRRKSGPTIIRPQQVTEKSLMESVAGFIHEVQSYNQPQNDNKTQIIWAKFEHSDINDPSRFPQNQDLNGNSSPLLLILGYTQGIQVWCIQGSGEAQLVLSWYHGQVKCMKILPNPEALNPFSDPYNPSRPLAAICDSSGPGPAFMSVTFVSLATGEQVSSIKFNNEIVDILANRRVVCIAFREKVAVFSALTFKERFTLTSCYPSPGIHSNPLALHSRWLAYADKTLYHGRRSSGGMEGDLSQSTVTAWGINVGSKLASGVAKVCSNIFTSSPKTSTTVQGDPIDGECGVVTILDTVNLKVGDEDNGYDLNNAQMDGVIAHFVAHSKAIVGLQFDPSGSLLLTADKPGNSFNIFRIVAHPLGSSYAAVHHLYSLYRGDTPGSVQDISFSSDSRWVSVSTIRGTTHIFPICPYGGAVGVRTHTSHRVVNKLSRFHRSAGLNENPGTPSSGRNSPNPNLGSSPANKSFDFPPGMGGNMNLAYPCPHLPPFPSPTVIQPIAQLRQPYIVTITSTVALPANRKNVGGKKGPEDKPIRVVAAFAPSRAKMVPGLHSNSLYRSNKRAADSLFVMSNHGQLLEYSLEPVPDQTLPRDKVCESSPIELNVTPFGQWNLFHPIGKERLEVAPPLSSTNPLLLAKVLMMNTEEDEWNNSEDDEDERWLSQVEILSHIGPARRLWMGPQFSFRPFQKPGMEDELKDLDVTVACRPRTEPMTMPGGGAMKQKPVFIECGSANSFELSPRFANNATRGSQEQVSLDVEKEINEAMSDTVKPKKNLQGDLRPDEFFCISTEDISRSRHSSDIHRGVEMVTAETKIFSVAVEQGKSKESSEQMVYKDVRNQGTERPVMLDSKYCDDSGDEFHPVFRDPTLLEDGLMEEAQQDLKPDELAQDKDKEGSSLEKGPESCSQEKGAEGSCQVEGDREVILSELQAAISQEEVVKSEPEIEPKKKNKKKKGRAVEPPMSCSSADEMKEVETKIRKKKGKNKEKEEKLPAPAPPITQADPFDDDFPSLGKAHEIKEPARWNKSSEREKEREREREREREKEREREREKSEEKDLMDMSSDHVQDEEDNDQVDFFIRDRSSSMDSERLENATRVNPWSAKPPQSPWLNKMLERGGIEDQISGAVTMYEDEDEKGSDDDDMKEFEPNAVVSEQNQDENSPHQLEEEEDEPIVCDTRQHPEEKSGSKPSKKKPEKQMEDSATDFEGWQDAASSEPENLKDTNEDAKDGWSFEVDEDDVNKILSQSDEVESTKDPSEERTALEDIFRFDSEMAGSETEENTKTKFVKGNRVSVEDLSDALRDETDSEAETGEEKARKWETTDEEASCGEQDKPSATLGSSCTGTSSCSEGSVSNSPNPRANKPTQGKKKNKKKRR